MGLFYILQEVKSLYAVFIAGELHPLGMDKMCSNGLIISEMIFADRHGAMVLMSRAKRDPKYKDEKLYIREVDPRQAELNGWVNARWPPVCKL